MSSTLPAYRITLTIPVIFLVLAATALPIEFRTLGEARFSVNGFDDVLDIMANVIGYLPVGIVLARLGTRRAVSLAGLISMFAETSQLVMLHRDPSFIDVFCNVTGATLGSLASARWKMGSPTLKLNRWKVVLAAMSAPVLLLYVWSLSGAPTNTRGATSPGTLEAYWKLDERSGRAALDYSGHELTGQFRREPPRAAGVTAAFDGTNYVDFGHSSAFRLAGSATISAWINSSSYPDDDAAIVSELRVDRGFQLDTTIDRGPRTIGFKLSGACGELVARYGATPLALNTRYHVAGVYDAAAQTLDVYLNGQLDNGFLLGSVSNAQRSSRGPLYVGRRGNSNRFNFSGSIEEVRIYSFALTKSQIEANMRGEIVEAPTGLRSTGNPPCATLSDPEDKELPFIAALLGTLVAFACLGLWPSAARLLVLGISFAAGALLVAVTAPNLPPFNTWMLPLVALAGGSSVVASARWD